MTVTPYAIRWADDLEEINLIGPYNTADERDADMRRLAALPGMSLVQLGPSHTDRMCAGVPTPPQRLITVTDVEDFLAAVGRNVLYVSPDYLQTMHDRADTAQPDDFAALMGELGRRAERRPL